MTNSKYVKVIIPSLNLDYLTYEDKSADLKIGDIVMVPYRSNQKLAVVIEINSKLDFDKVKIKEITEIYKEYKLSEKLIEFVKRSAKYYINSTSKFLKLVIPNDKFLQQNLKIREEANLHSMQINYNNLNYNQPLLSELQDAACKDIQALGNDFNVIVLDGVTGSGKTEIYLKIIKDLLIASDKQILIMLPEIALTSQVESKIKERFGIDVAVWHSDTSLAQKKRIFQAVISGEVRLLIGARSSLYLPYKNLGLIVIDEEHDLSYKQEEQVIYNARDMAILRSFIENFPIILCSATPSLETINNIDIGSYKHIIIAEKFANKHRPEFKIIDLKLYKMAVNSWISPPLLADIRSCIDSGDQALLFLNRRGYAPLNVCNSCGYRLNCNNCSCWLVAHKELGKYICHHCGYEKKIINKCPSCGVENSLRPVGPGVERIYEEIKQLIPEARPILLSKDQLSSLSKSQEILQKIRNKEYNILIGTQVIAKGFHFPDLTLVGIIDNDIAFAGGDLRAHEKTFQLLEQVSGRSAREKAGKVIIQTYEPENILVQSVVNNNKEAFLSAEKKNRKYFSMPPFGKLVSIVFKGKNEKKLADFVNEFTRLAPRSKDCLVLGPTPASMVKIAGQFRYKILLKIPRKFDCHAYISQWLKQIKIPSYVQIKIDVDPYNFI